MMDYKIIVTISHQFISFEYSLRGGETGVLPMSRVGWPAPLAFYCTENGITIGADALQASQRGVMNAFCNYFKLLRNDTLRYEYAGESKPINNLLRDAAETVFREFYRDVLFNRCGKLEDNRCKMPLAIVCEGNVEAHERNFVENSFRDSGYNSVQVLPYDYFLGKYISQLLNNGSPCKYYLSAWSEGDDMILTLFDSQKELDRVVLEGLCKDPRLDYVIKSIWGDISGQNGFLNYESEYDIIRKAAEHFLSSTEEMVNDDIILSDRITSYRYSLRRIHIDSRPYSQNEDLGRRINEFLSRNRVDDRNSVQLFLRGTLANSRYFNDCFRREFRNVKICDNDFQKVIMNLVVEETVTAPEPPKVDVAVLKRLQREWREKNAEVAHCSEEGKAVKLLNDFLTKCRNANASELCAEVEAMLKNCRRNAKLDEAALKQLQRDWREVKAEVAHCSDVNKAVKSLEDFFAKCRNANATKLCAEVEAMLKDCRRNAKLDEAALKQLQRDWREVKAEVAHCSDVNKAVKLLEDFLKKCKSSNAVELGKTVESQLAETKKKLSSSLTVDMSALKRQWREVRAVAKTGNPDVALRTLEAFRDECRKKGAVELVELVEHEINNIRPRKKK